MKTWLSGITIGIVFFLFSGIVYWQYQEKEYKMLLLEVVCASSHDKSSNEDEALYSLADLQSARESGKQDGKVEVMLMMQTQLEKNIDEQSIERIISIAEKYPKDLEKNINFLSLLSQSAFHKGLNSGMESSEYSYEEGYHKAIEDFTCPETGNMKLPRKEEKPSK